VNLLQSAYPDLITREKYDAVLFDLDGVLTDTVKMHAMCWKKMFDEYLERRTNEKGEPFHPFDIATDYRLFVDGKPRFDGVRDFLKSRGIQIPEGTPADSSHKDTVCGVGNRKNELVNDMIDTVGVDAYMGTVAFLRQVRHEGLKTAVVTSSQNCDAVLNAAKIGDLFDVRVDGNTIIAEHLAGKPAPDSFVKAAEMLGVQKTRAVVIEDAIAGVQAGANGGFGLVIGVARTGNAEELKKNGAHIVVNDMDEFLRDR